MTKPRLGYRIALVSALGKKCVRCGSTDGLEIDHIIPLDKGGTDDIVNMQVLCHDCHMKKHYQKGRDKRKREIEAYHESHKKKEFLDENLRQLLAARGIPANATVRELYTNCGKCPERHGPYAYAEWKVGSNVRTAYLGKVTASQTAGMWTGTMTPRRPAYRKASSP